MNHYRRNNEATQRIAERRRREDEAPRLIVECPTLATLRLELHEQSGGSPVAEPGHVRRIVVAHAPALFDLPCGDPRCKDGGHDMTRLVLDGLRHKEERFEGEDACNGSTGTGRCSRSIHMIAIATYNATPSAT